MFPLPRRLLPLIAASAVVTALAAWLPATPSALVAPPPATEAPVPQLPATALLRLLLTGFVHHPGARRAARRVRAISAMARRMAPSGDSRHPLRRHDAVPA